MAMVGHCEALDSPVFRELDDNRSPVRLGSRSFLTEKLRRGIVVVVVSIINIIQLVVVVP